MLGLAVIAAGCYIGFAPALYFFARRQQERRSAAWAFITAGCFAICLALIGVSLFAFLMLKASWENECRDFARTAFDRTFVEHDAEFLAQHSTTTPKELSPQRFVWVIQDQLGALETVEPPVVRVRSRLAWPALHVDGLAVWQATFANAPRTTISMQLSGNASDWRIEHIRWDYR